MITNLREIGAASVRRRRHLRQTLLAVGFAGLVALAPTAGLLARINPDFEDAQHAEIGDSAAQLLVQGDLAEFERQADALRQSRELTPAGVWKLGLFYDGSARIAPNHPHDPAWAQAEASTGAYLNAHPTSSSALIAAVRVLNAHAVELREGGADVEDTRAAAALTERAKNLLEKYRASGIRDPDWYASRIVVSLDQESSKSEIIALAKEALLREPTYQPLLYAVSDALRPDHGGSTELHQQFVTLALAASHEQLGSQAYGRIMFNLVRRGTDPIGALGTVGADWPKLKASLAEITSAFPIPGMRMPNAA